MSITTSMPNHRSLLLTTVAGLATWLGAEGVAAATPCAVTEAADDGNLSGTLRWCVNRVNQGLADHVQIQAAHWYAPATPLVLERSARISGYGRIVMPGDEFVGDSLFVVGTQCPGPGCQGLAQVEIEGLEIAAVGVEGVRGIDVRAGHELVLEDVSLYEFQKPASSGGCVRTGQQSVLTIIRSTFEGCTAADGGAVFSEATSTMVSESVFRNNVAGWNGGAIKIGTGNFFTRTLFVETSSFKANSANWGGALATGGFQIEAELVGTELLDNVATTRGGALHGKGSLEGCLVQGNHAGTSGGGLFLQEDGTVTDSTLWGNESVVGGGLTFQPAGDYRLYVDHSTVAFNAISDDAARGAGLAVLGGDAFVRNSTVTDNLAKDHVDTTYGGGLAVLNAKASIEHATFANNYATVGGGIYSDAQSVVILGSSIVAYSSGHDCEILGDLDTTTSLDTDSTCRVELSGVDPQLDSFGDHQGPTWTWLPNAAEVQGVAACLAAEDQRHEPRPEKECDIGSVEL
jgi:predicted outer membrane repeat protein